MKEQLPRRKNQQVEEAREESKLNIGFVLGKLEERWSHKRKRQVR
jgi:hypothetical protein